MRPPVAVFDVTCTAYVTRDPVIGNLFYSRLSLLRQPSHLSLFRTGIGRPSVLRHFHPTPYVVKMNAPMQNLAISLGVMQRLRFFIYHPMPSLTLHTCLS